MTTPQPQPHPTPDAPAAEQPTKKKSNILKYAATALVAFLVGIGAGNASAGGSQPTTASGPQPTATVTETVASPAETVTETVEAAAPAPEAAPATSTCDNAREAFLTGSKADIQKALKALQSDKSADSTAREYARYYLVRDAGNKSLQELDASLIQTACS